MTPATVWCLENRPLRATVLCTRHDLGHQLIRPMGRRTWQKYWETDIFNRLVSDATTAHWMLLPSTDQSFRKHRLNLRRLILFIQRHYKPTPASVVSFAFLCSSPLLSQGGGLGRGAPLGRRTPSQHETLIHIWHQAKQRFSSKLPALPSFETPLGPF